MGRSGISWTICKQSAPRSRQITTSTPHHSIFTGRMLFLTPNQQCQSTEGKLPECSGRQQTQSECVCVRACGYRGAQRYGSSSVSATSSPSGSELSALSTPSSYSYTQPHTLSNHSPAVDLFCSSAVVDPWSSSPECTLHIVPCIMSLSTQLPCFVTV